jgi:hypothetical protein
LKLKEVKKKKEKGRSKEKKEKGRRKEKKESGKKILEQINK